jgi:hypothetical protein
MSYSNYCNRNPFIHYKIRANVYMVLGRGVVGRCFWCPLLFVFGGWGVSRVGKSSGCTRLRLWYALVSTSVILNHCIKTRFLVCISRDVRVGVTELYLQILWVCWSPPTPQIRTIMDTKNNYQPHPSLIPCRH